MLKTNRNGLKMKVGDLVLVATEGFYRETADAKNI